LVKKEIDELVEAFGKELDKTPIPGKDIQLALINFRGELLKNLLFVVGEFVKMVKGFTITIPRAEINRLQTAQEAIETLTDMKKEIDWEVFARMPRHHFGETSVPSSTQNPVNNTHSLAETVIAHTPTESDDFEFFQMNHNATNEEIMKEFASRGLRPVDGFELLRINKIRGNKFAYRYPNATIWYIDGVWCYAVCHEHLGTVQITIKEQTAGSWQKEFWFVGVRLLS
jgi:hypothetical protein